MTEQKSEAKTPPGSGAGDAAHSMRIPQIDRPDSSAPSGSTSTSTTKPNGTKTENRAAKSKPESKTDKGRTRPATGPKPLSASDYARTTTSSPDTTSVIPSVKDEEPPVDTTTKTAPAQQSAPVESSSARWVEEDDHADEPQQSSAGFGGGGRSAVLRMAYIEPWSVTRMAFAVSVALMIVAVVATAIFWLVLEVTGIWDTVNDSVTSVLSDDAAGFDITDYLGFGRLVGLALVLSALNVVIMTVLATIAAHLYNLAAQLLGGFQVRFVSKS